MGTLRYTAITSLDGYVADAHGRFDWSEPDSPVFDAHIERLGDVSTEVLGRKTYELMRYWENEPADERWSDAEHEFARRWQELDKVVVSTTLTAAQVPGERFRVVGKLGLDGLRRLVEEAPGVVEIFGPTTAAPAIRAGLVTEFALFMVPKLVGGGLRALPEGVDLDLHLDDHHIFDNGVALLQYSRA